jgi:hypothetical protein
MAENKSHSLGALLAHTILYSVLWIFPIILLLELKQTLLFILITFLSHTLTDYFTSKIVKNKYENEFLKGVKYNIPNTGMFSVIGFDQFLHYLQLFLTYYLLQ